jgi:Uma2 family endonuclease
MEPAAGPQPYRWTQQEDERLRALGLLAGQEAGGRRWTAADFFRLIDLGWFQDRRVELIDGEVIERPAQHNLHLAAITLSADALRLAFGPGHWVRVQGTLDLSPLCTPDPDLAVVPGSPRGAPATNPTTALLVVEVAETTLAYDRGRKACLYAAAGIADYWIVNLVQRQLEVHRDPLADAAQPFGHRYGSRTILDPGDRAMPLGAPGDVLVADLLP